MYSMISMYKTLWRKHCGENTSFIWFQAKHEKEQFDGLCRASGGKYAGTLLSDNLHFRKTTVLLKRQELQVSSHVCTGSH